MQPEQKFITIEDHKVAFLDWNSQGEKIIICIHGVNRNSRDFDFLAKSLAIYGFRIIAIDMIGRGLSDYFADYTMYNYAVYVRILKKFVESLSFEKFSLIGSSMGGIISLFITEIMPEKINAIILNDVGPHVENKNRRILYKYIAQYPEFNSILEYQNYLRFLLAPLNITEEIHWQHIFKYGMKDLDGKIYLNFDEGITRKMKDGVNTNMNLWKVWYAIEKSISIRIIRGERSKFLTSETLLEMLHTRENTDFIQYPKTGHTPSLMDYNQIEDIKRWLLRINSL